MFYLFSIFRHRTHTDVKSERIQNMPEYTPEKNSVEYNSFTLNHILENNYLRFTCQIIFMKSNNKINIF